MSQWEMDRHIVSRVTFTTDAEIRDTLATLELDKAVEYVRNLIDTRHTQVAGAYLSLGRKAP